MFEEARTIEEVSAEKCIRQNIPVLTKSIFATSILLSMKYARDVANDCPLIPRTFYYNASNQLRFIIYKLIVKYIDDNNLGEIKFHEPRNEKGLTIPEFIVNSNVTIHLKKTLNSEKLPVFSQARKEKSIVNEQLSLPFEDFNNYFCLVTYNHRKFNLKYMQIGVPDKNYEKWLYTENILTYIDKDIEENIDKNYSNEIKEDFNRKTQKEYKLAIK